MKRYEVVVDVYIPATKSEREWVYKARWKWSANLKKWSYLYGTAFMPLAGAYVMDAWIRKVRA